MHAGAPDDAGEGPTLPDEMAWMRSTIAQDDPKMTASDPSRLAFRNTT